MEENNLPATIRLDESNEDLVIEMLIEGRHYKDIAAHFNSSLTGVFRYLSRPNFLARVKEAREFAAHVLVDEAERVLAQAKNDPRLFAVARELAQHYRWKASMINREQYASRKEVIEIPTDSSKEKDELIIRWVEDTDGN